MLTIGQKLDISTVVDFDTGDFVMSLPKREPSIDRVREMVSYDPLTGEFTWLVNAKNIRAGSPAGWSKLVTGNRQYRYLKIDEVEMQASRVAWALHYGEWPKSRISFIDKDSLNLSIKNLKLQNALTGKYDMHDPAQRAAYMKAHRAAYPKAWKETHLQRTFGLSLAEYTAMAVAQDNKCAICGLEETSVRGERVKALSVDHDHATGAVRALLCHDCNTGIGKLKDSPATLRAAADYIERHAAKVVSIGARRAGASDGET